jgi:ADP-ribosylglycohydrolase
MTTTTRSGPAAGGISGRITGSVLASAIGDALGYPHEFRSVRQVQREIGPAGITDFIALQDPRFTRPFIVGTAHPPGTFTDDTQMSIAVGEALVEVGAPYTKDRHDALMKAMAREFVAWFFGDENDRSPGETTGIACTALRDGVPWHAAGVAHSKGCGANMRVGPIGLFYDDTDIVAAVAADCARITHAHPTALVASEATALCTALALRGDEPPAIHAYIARHIAGRAPDLEALWQRIPGLLSSSPDEVLVDLEKNPHGLGESWVADEAIASAFWCFWRHPDDARACLLEAINTDGDSDSIGAIVGAIVGARVGVDALPPAWVQDVEDSPRLHDLAERLARGRC